MRRYGKKLTALLLALCMLLALAACGSGGDSGDAEQLSGTIYVPEFLECDLDLDYINSGCCDGRYGFSAAAESDFKEARFFRSDSDFRVDSRLPLSEKSGAVMINSVINRFPDFGAVDQERDGFSGGIERFRTGCSYKQTFHRGYLLYYG